MSRNGLPQYWFWIALTWVAACYAPGLHEDLFLIDDQSLIQVPQILSPFSWEIVKVWLTPGAHVDFYPLRDLSYWVDIHVLGADGRGVDASVFRIQNAAWMVMAALWLRALISRMGLAPLWRDWIPVLWLLHPVHSELWMWPSARKDVMALAFGLGSVTLFLGHARRGRGWGPGIGAVALFAASLLSKATFVLLPLSIPLCALLLGEKSWLRPRIVAIWGSALALGLLSAALQAGLYRGTTDMTFAYESSYRVQGVLSALGRATRGWIDPRVNAVDVENWGSWVDFNSRFLGWGVLAATAFLGASAWAAYRRSRFLWALVICGAVYLPTSGLLFPHRNFYSVRYFEAALAVVLVAGACLLSRVRASERTLQGFLGILALLAALATRGEARNWEDGISPFTHALRVTPGQQALMRFKMNALLNEFRWGRLSTEGQAELAALKAALAEDCSSDRIPDVLPNGHLCLGVWLEPLLNLKPHQDIAIDQWETLARRALARVNPEMKGRLERKIWIRQSLSAGEGRKPPDVPLLGQEKFRFATPGDRLEYWSFLCMLRDRDTARTWLEGQLRGRTLSQASLNDFILDWDGLNRAAAGRLRNCARKLAPAG